MELNRNGHVAMQGLPPRRRAAERLEAGIQVRRDLLLEMSDGAAGNPWINREHSELITFCNLCVSATLREKVSLFPVSKRGHRTR